MRGVIDGDLERAAHVVGNAAFKRAGEVIRRRADQIGAGNARKQRTQRLDAAFFRFAAGDPINRLERRQRLLRRVGIGRFRIVDEENAAAPADLFHAMRQTGKVRSACCSRARSCARLPSAATAEAAFCAL